MSVVSRLVVAPQDGRAAEAVADLTRAIEISDPSPACLHYLAKALKVDKIRSMHMHPLLGRSFILSEALRQVQYICSMGNKRLYG